MSRRVGIGDIQVPGPSVEAGDAADLDPGVERRVDEPAAAASARRRSQAPTRRRLPDRRPHTDRRKRLRSEGVMFGSHSETHPALTGLTNTAVVREATRSRRILEVGLGLRVDAFAYPYGAVDPAVDPVGACGYTFGSTCRAGPQPARRHATRPAQDRGQRRRQLRRFRPEPRCLSRTQVRVPIHAGVTPDQ